MKRLNWVLAAGLSLAALFSGASALGLEEEGGAHALGVCSDGSEYEIAMVPEIGLAFETEIEPGEEAGRTTAGEPETWHLRMAYKGRLVINVWITADEDGGFTYRRVFGNLEGDRLSMQAENLVTGEKCQGGLEAEL